MASTADGTGNLLLDAVVPDERAELLDAMTAADLPIGRNLYDPFGDIAVVYFPTCGVISVTTPMDDGSQVETATVGPEGFAAAAAYLGTRQMGEERVFVQVEGRGYRMDVDLFEKAAAGSERFDTILRGYVQAYLAQAAYGVACNAKHRVEERCARWLLQTHDRVESDDLALTQQFLAEMLGVRRPTVTLTARTLQRAGLIEYRRGTITVRDRIGLEEASCSCYEKIRSAYSRLVPLAA